MAFGSLQPFGALVSHSSAIPRDVMMTHAIYSVPVTLIITVKLQLRPVPTFCLILSKPYFYREHIILPYLTSLFRVNLYS